MIFAPTLRTTFAFASACASDCVLLPAAAVVAVVPSVLPHAAKDAVTVSKSADAITLLRMFAFILVISLIFVLIFTLMIAFLFRAKKMPGSSDLTPGHMACYLRIKASTSFCKA